MVSRAARDSEEAGGLSVRQCVKKNLVYGTEQDRVCSDAQSER